MDLQLIKYIDRYAGIPICYILWLWGLFRRKKVNNIKKILIIKFSGFGNIVLALPSIRAIRRKYPKSEIVFLTHTMNQAITDKDPSIDRILAFDVSTLYKTFKNTIKLIKKIKAEKFDMVVDLEQFSRFSAIISFLSKAQIRAGFDTDGQGRGMLYNLKVAYNNAQHTSKIFSDLAKALGSKVDLEDLKIVTTKEDNQTIDNFLNENKIVHKDILIGIHPGCGTNNPKRKWAKEKFAKLADFLIQEYGAKIYFTGQGQESNLIKEIQSIMNHSSIDASNKFNLRELAEIISRSRIFFSNDTGPLHICSAMKTPVACFFGPNTPKLYGPLGEKNIVFYKNMKCSPCTTNFNEKSTNCKHFKCIKDITLEEVKDKIKNSKLI